MCSSNSCRRTCRLQPRPVQQQVQVHSRLNSTSVVVAQLQPVQEQQLQRKLHPCPARGQLQQHLPGPLQYLDRRDQRELRGVHANGHTQVGALSTTWSASSSRFGRTLTPQPASLHLIVMNIRDEAVLFKVAPTTRFYKIMDAYAANEALDRDTLRYVHDGQRLKRDDTPVELELEDYDVIRVYEEQSGC